MTSRWWFHAVALAVALLLPAPFLLGAVPLPPWAAGLDRLGVGIAWGMAWFAHASLTSLGVKLMDLGVRGTLALHAGLWTGVGSLIALAWPRH